MFNFYWEISLILYDKDYFPNARKNNEDCIWGYSLFGERPVNYIKKPITDCTCNEILLEILYHFNMLDIKDEVLKHAHISTCMMPYITSQFMPRKISDRPQIIQANTTNHTFIGQFVELEGNVVKALFFTVISTFFYTFVPVQYFFLTPNIWWMLGSIVVTTLWVIIAFVLFKIGLEKYNSGSLMGGRI